jgi:hypothetical protein
MWFLRRHRNEAAANGVEADKAVADAAKNLNRIQKRAKEVTQLRDQFADEMEETLLRRPKEGPAT